MRWISAAIVGIWSMLGSAVLAMGADHQQNVVIECQPIQIGHTRDVYGPRFRPETFEIDIERNTGLGPFQHFPEPATFSDAYIEWALKVSSYVRYKYIVNLAERSAYRKEYLGPDVSILQFHSCKQISGTYSLFP